MTDAGGVAKVGGTFMVANQCPTDDEGYTTTCVIDDSPAPLPARPNTWAMAFWIGLVIALAIIEYHTRPSTGRRSPSRFLKRYTGRILKIVGLIGFAVLGWHLFFGGPL